MSLIELQADGNRQLHIVQYIVQLINCTINVCELIYIKLNAECCCYYVLKLLLSSF